MCFEGKNKYFAINPGPDGQQVRLTKNRFHENKNIFHVHYHLLFVLHLHSSRKFSKKAPELKIFDFQTRKAAQSFDMLFSQH